MEQRGTPRLNPFLSDAAITFVPELTDDQLMRVVRGLVARYPHALVGRLTDFTALIQGIPIEAESEHDAKRAIWDVLSREVRSILSAAVDAGTELTSIDIRLPAESLFDLG